MTERVKCTDCGVFVPIEINATVALTNHYEDVHDLRDMALIRAVMINTQR